MSTSIATGKKPALVMGRDSLRFLYWIDSGNVKGQIRDASNAIVAATFTAVTGVADSGLAVGQAVQHGGKRVLVMLVSVGGTETQYTSLDGITWS